MSQLGGGFRQQRWCEYYLARGHSVRLFYVGGITSVAWTDVHTVDDLRAKRAAWIDKAPPKAGVRDSRFASIARLIKHTLLMDLFYPSIFRLLLLLNATKRRAPGVTVLLCSSPPFAMAVVGRIIKAVWGDAVFMALDMRDLWSMHTAFRGPKLHKRWIERWVVHGADDFTTVSVGLAIRFEEAFSTQPKVVYNVATHVQELPSGDAMVDWTVLSPSLRAASRKLVYTGSVPEGFYDLDMFVSAVEHFAAAVPDAADRLQLVFVGAGGELASRVAQSRIPKGVFVFLPQMAHKDASLLQGHADALLFLGYKAADNQGQVSIKLFEYFRRGRPLLPVFIRPNSDVDRLVKLYCGSCPHLNSAPDVADALSRLARYGATGLPLTVNREADEILKTEYDRTVERILAGID
ncbi:hypothetical protein KQX64_20965 [Rhodopseudomonas palustris]|nr:hypothetical protein KQX64_20965 [Rhodopseudomonas palustris]